MKVPRIHCSTEVTNEHMLRDAERMERYIHADLTNQIAHELAKSAPKSITRLPIPNPSYSCTPEKFTHPQYLFGYRYEMELYVFTREEMEKYHEDLRRQILFDMAADRALAATTIMA